MERILFNLPDGRQLAALRHGPNSKKLIVFFHATGSSGHALTPDTGSLQEAGAGLLVVQRPGAGASSCFPGYGIGQVVADVRALLVAMAAEKVYLAACTGGALFALHFAAACPETVAGVGLISPVLPGFPYYEQAIPGIRSSFGKMMLRTPGLDWLLVRWLAGRMKRQPERFLERWVAAGPLADRVVVEQIHKRVALLTDLREAWKRQGRAVLDEVRAMRQETGLCSIDMPLDIWQGTSDPGASPEIVRVLQRISRQTRMVEAPRQGRLMYLELWPAVQQHALKILAPV